MARPRARPGRRQVTPPGPGRGGRARRASFIRCKPLPARVAGTDARSAPGDGARKGGAMVRFLVIGVVAALCAIGAAPVPLNVTP